MDTQYILFFLLLFILIYISYCNNYSKETYVNMNVKIPENILNYFSEMEFLKNTGDFQIKYLEYKKDNLNVEKYTKGTITDFIEQTLNDQDNRYQIKQIFNNNKLSTYILNNAYTPIVKLLGLNNVKPGYIRISKKKWSFDYHYDCLNLLLVQLCGTRTIYTKKTLKSKIEKHILNPGDTLYIPLGVYHKVETNSNLNINFNIIFEEKNDNKIIKCNKNFKKDYKIQHKQCKTNNCI